MNESTTPYDITPLPVYPIEIGFYAWVILSCLILSLLLLIRFIFRSPKAQTPESAFLVVERTLLTLAQNHRGIDCDQIFLNKISLIGRRFLSVLLNKDLSSLTDGELRQTALDFSGPIVDALNYLSSFEEIRYGGERATHKCDEVAFQSLELFRECDRERKREEDSLNKNGVKESLSR